MPSIQPSLTRKELQELARLRVQEAEALYKAGLYDGAVYLAGYAVELALKSRICKILKLPAYPDSGDIGKTYKTHKLDQLRTLAALSSEITISKNKDLFDNWSTAVAWDPEQRYAAAGHYTQKGAREVLDSIASKPNGVFTWLTKRW